jgi:hypothetical protein
MHGDTGGAAITHLTQLPLAIEAQSLPAVIMLSSQEEAREFWQVTPLMIQQNLESVEATTRQERTTLHDWEVDAEIGDWCLTHELHEPETLNISKQ